MPPQTSPSAPTPRRAGPHLGLPQIAGLLIVAATAVLVGRWFPGRLAEIKEISRTDEFQDPPGYFRDAYAMYIDRLSEA